MDVKEDTNTNTNTEVEDTTTTVKKPLKNVNSLTCVTDAKKEDTDSIFRPSTAGPLSDKEMKEACKNLIRDGLSVNYPEIERSYIDPKFEEQNFCLHSFLPAQDAKPNKDGIYGMIKFRGTFRTSKEANERAEYLIKNVDSAHPILTSVVGKPIPVTINYDKFIHHDDVKEVELKENIHKICKENLYRENMKDKQVIKEIKEKEKELLHDTTDRLDHIKQKIKNTRLETSGSNAPKVELMAEPGAGEYDSLLEEYIVQRVKRAQILHLLYSHVEKIKEMKKVLIPNEKRLHEIERIDQNVKKEYEEKFLLSDEIASSKNPTGPYEAEKHFIDNYLTNENLFNKPIMFIFKEFIDTIFV